MPAKITTKSATAAATASYPYGHPFWLGKPTREELFEAYPWGLLKAFKNGLCFLNMRGESCHPDSYGTTLSYNAADKVIDLLTAEFAVTQAEWIAFADYWIDHINRQPITVCLGYHIRHKVGAPSKD